MKRQTRDSLGLFIVCLAVPLIVGLLGAVATSRNIPTWYAGLRKPSFNPPDWVFGPVWTVLYSLMGASWYLVLRHGLSHPRVRTASTVFLVHLFLNGIWSPVFFALHWRGAALAVIVLLLLAIAVTMIVFQPISRWAARLLVPCLLWVAYATVLNAAIWWMNRGAA